MKPGEGEALNPDGSAFTADWKMTGLLEFRELNTPALAPCCSPGLAGRSLCPRGTTDLQNESFSFSVPLLPCLDKEETPIDCLTPTCYVSALTMNLMLMQGFSTFPYCSVLKETLLSGFTDPD